MLPCFSFISEILNPNVILFVDRNPLNLAKFQLLVQFSGALFYFRIINLLSKTDFWYVWPQVQQYKTIQIASISLVDLFFYYANLFFSFLLMTKNFIFSTLLCKLKLPKIKFIFHVTEMSFFDIRSFEVFSEQTFLTLVLAKQASLLSGCLHKIFELLEIAL